MPRIFKMKEIKVVTENKPGTLVRVTSPIADVRVNIGAFFGYAKDKSAEFYFITADNEKVKRSLEKAGFACVEREVIVIETANESGTLFRSAEQLAKSGVDLEYAYSTAGNFGTTWIIFATKKIEQAMNVMP